jgi:DNA-directed RNA polymerase subunit RPC12/RpoP
MMRVNSLTELEYKIGFPDPSGRYVVLRGSQNSFGLTTIGQFPTAFCRGCEFRILLKVRRRIDDVELKVFVTPRFDLDTNRFGGRHDWVIRSDMFTDHRNQVNVIVDLNGVLAREYTKDKYDFLGVECLFNRHEIAISLQMTRALSQNKMWPNRKRGRPRPGIPSDLF